MRDWRDEEQDRRIEELHTRSTGGFDDLWELAVIVIGVIVVLFVIAGLLDSWFGWGLVDFMWAYLYDATDGFIGHPKS